MKGVILASLIMVIMAAVAMAAPYGPRVITVEQSDRRAEFNESVSSIQAQAGNVTRLRINVSISTKRWQGYYGNLSGKITLDDANGYSMYDWTASNGGFSSIGEVYAANYTVSDWTRVMCVNLTANSTCDDRCEGPNTTVLEDMYGANAGDADGVDETFTSVENVTIGTTTLLNCPATHIYQNSSAQSRFWNEALLWENHSTGINTVIYAVDVDQDTRGFNNESLDFQMIVGEDGDIPETTTYYFYMELV